MKKIQKCQMGATLGLDLAPYSFSAPASAASAAEAGSATAAGSAVLPTLATIGKVAWPLALAGGATFGGLYLLGHAKNGAVSGAIEAAAERERQRHLAEAEAKWKEKNQHYANLISTHGPIQYPVGTFYDYDPSTGTAYLERDLGNGHVGRWTQNMRTHEQGNPYVYDTTTGEIYNGEMTGPHSAYVPVPRSLTPITLSTGQTVALPSDITDYRVFDESADDQTDLAGSTVVLDDSEDNSVPVQQPGGGGSGEEQGGENEGKGKGENEGKGKGKVKGPDRQRKKDKPGFWDNFKQGRSEVVGNTNYGYRLGKVVGWLENHPIITGSGIIGGAIAYSSYNNNKDSNKGSAKSNAGIDESALTNHTTGTGETGTVKYQPDQIPRDTTSMSTVVWPY